MIQINRFVGIWGRANPKWKNDFRKTVSCHINTHHIISTCYKIIHFSKSHPFFLQRQTANTSNKRFINCTVMFFYNVIYDFFYAPSTLWKICWMTSVWFSYSLPSKEEIARWSQLLFLLPLTFITRSIYLCIKTDISSMNFSFCIGGVGDGLVMRASLETIFWDLKLENPEKECQRVENRKETASLSCHSSLVWHF